MISNKLEITVHIANLAVKQLVNNTYQSKLQSGVFGVTSLFISYNIKAKSVCVCITAGEEIYIFMTHLPTP